MTEYLSDLNATAAARRAGYGHANASRIGPRMTQHPGIAAAILAAQAKVADRAEISIARVLNEFALVGFADIGDVLDFSGDALKLKPANQIPEHARRALSSVKVKRYMEGHGDDAREVELTEFKLWDKLSALEKIGRHLGAFPKEGSNVNVNVAVGVSNGGTLARNAAASPESASVADQLIDQLASGRHVPAGAGPDDDERAIPPGSAPPPTESKAP